MVRIKSRLQMVLAAALVACTGLTLLYFESKSMARAAFDLRRTLCKPSEHCTNVAFHWPDAIEVDYPKGVKPPADIVARYVALKTQAPGNLRPYLPARLVVGVSLNAR